MIERLTTHRVRTMAVAACLTVVAGCGASSEVQAGASGAGGARIIEEPTAPSRVFDDVIEPANALVSDFGDGWELGEQWYTEAEVGYSTGCAQFDTLIDVDNWGPISALWRSGDTELVQLVADVNRNAGSYWSAANGLSEACPSIELAGDRVSVTGFAVSDPDAATYALSAAPRPDPASGGEQPVFDPGRTAWVVVLIRENVVSRLTLSIDDDDEPRMLNELIAITKKALKAAPIESAGPLSEEGEREEGD